MVGKAEIAASKADGQKISPASACDDTFMDEVTNVLENFLGGIPKNPLGGVIGEASDFLGDVNAVAKKMQRLANNPSIIDDGFSLQRVNTTNASWFEWII